MTRKTIETARQTQKSLSKSREEKAKRLVQTLETFLSRTEQVIDQTTRRILQGEQVPVFRKDREPIRRAYGHHPARQGLRPVEFGHKVWLNEVEGGLVSHYRILEGNPSDEQQWEPSLKAHLKTFHQPPQQASADRGLFSETMNNWLMTWV